jgi:hypothetical protein
LQVIKGKYSGRSGVVQSIGSIGWYGVKFGSSTRVVKCRSCELKAERGTIDGETHQRASVTRRSNLSASSAQSSVLKPATRVDHGVSSASRRTAVHALSDSHNARDIDSFDIFDEIDALDLEDNWYCHRLLSVYYFCPFVLFHKKVPSFCCTIQKASQR